MKFTKLYEDVKATDLFKPASAEEVAKRKEQYGPMQLKEAFDSVEKTKLPDGTWHILETLNVSDCNLSTLKDLNVSKVDGNFWCDHNNLTDLVGAPNTVNGSFLCYKNYLTTLKGAPIRLNREFACYVNKLTNLEGAPREVYGNFLCHANDLISLKGAPAIVTGDFNCYNNNKKFDADDVRKICDVKGQIYT